MTSVHSEHLREENERLKTTIRSQEDKIKLLATKLVKYLTQTEDERKKVIELDNHIACLKEKVTVYKAQLASLSQLSSFGTPKVSSARVVQQEQSNSQSLETIFLEAKAENEALEDQIGFLKRIIIEKDEMIDRLQFDIAVPVQTDAKKLEENIKVIRSNREKMKTSSWLSALESQCSELQSECNKSKETIAQLETEVTEWSKKMNELQDRNLVLEKRVGEVTSFHFSGKESETMISALQSEINILKNVNEQLTGKLETRKPVMDESELKKQSLELERHLKAECVKNAELIRQKSLLLEKETKLPPPTRVTMTEETAVQVSMELCPCKQCKENESELTETQWQLVQVRDELEKIRSLLNNQIMINRDLTRYASKLSKVAPLL